MKFSKHQWERHKALQPVSKEMVEAKIKKFYPKASVEKFEVVSSGLANINVFFRITGINDSFLLRIYNRDNASLNLEMLLSQKFGHLIPMPEFLHVQNENSPESSFVIQKWFDGVPFYKILETPVNTNLTMTAKNIAFILNTITSQKFHKAGFFKNNLEINPYDNENNNHPFISYIEDCLFDGYAGKNLGDELRNELWTYVKENRDYFPKQEPACLVHGDFNFDNILVDYDSGKVIAILDWEFAFAGSHLFDIGTFLRFELPVEVKKEFIKAFERYSGTFLPNNYEKMIKIQDISNLVGLINHPMETPDRLRDVKCLIQETLMNYQ